MKKTLILLLLASCCLTNCSSNSIMDKQALNILERYKIAIGFDERQYKYYHEIGIEKWGSSNAVYKYEHFESIKGQYKNLMYVDNKINSNGFTGQYFWSKQIDSDSIEVQYEGDKTYNIYMDEVNFQHFDYLNNRNSKYEIKYNGITQLNEYNVYEISIISRKLEVERIIYISTQSNLMIRYIKKVDNREEISDYSDYKSIKNQVIPFKISTSDKQFWDEPIYLQVDTIIFYSDNDSTIFYPSF